MSGMKRVLNGLGFLTSGGVGIYTMIYVYKANNEVKPLSSKLRLDNKTVVITGATSGIGNATAYALASNHGAKVIMPSRDLKECEAARRSMQKEYGLGKERAKKMGFSAHRVQDPYDNTECRLCDLKSLKSVEEFAESVEKVDILVNNAAVLNPKPNTSIKKRVAKNGDEKKGSKSVKYDLSMTSDNIEEQFQVNYLSHFLLSNMLKDKLEKSDKPLIINVTCEAHLNGKLMLTDLKRLNETEDKKIKYDFRGLEMYRQSKLAQVLFTKQAEKNWKSINTISIDPGSSADTKLGRHQNQSGTDKLRFLDPGMQLQKTLHENKNAQAAIKINRFMFDANSRQLNLLKPESGVHYVGFEKGLDLKSTESIDVNRKDYRVGKHLIHSTGSEVDSYTARSSELLWKASQVLCGMDTSMFDK